VDFKLIEEWPEALTMVFIVLGFALAILLQSPAFAYFTTIISGALAGRVFYFKRFKEPIFPFIMIIAGFLVGYIVGSFWVNRMAVFMLFALAFIGMYYLHLKKIIGIFKSEEFFK